ncbi:MAG: sugar phosphate isomerase/epimerase [Verrucomicrobiales bacterium]|nr:sugar phosphate isomerase/epimerase [Verrucomicrobiales bacterium]
MSSPTPSRRQFLSRSSLAAGAFAMTGTPALADKPLFKISLAEWTINPELKSGKIDHLDFAQVAHDHGIQALEYVNQFFMEKAGDKSYLGEMKKRADDLGVRSLIIMCDREGNIGDPDEAARNQTVENHRKWIDAASFLGCHSIRVNAGSSGTWDEQVKLATDGLTKLNAFGAEAGIGIIVENHGGLSSNADWLAKVITTVGHENCGTLPDFGNFRISEKESYDSYEGIRKLMPWAKGVSVKDVVWDAETNHFDLDYDRMLKIVIDAGFDGYCGIEHGGFAGLNQSREKLEQVRDRLAGA